MSLWHCKCHGLHGPMAICSEASLAQIDLPIQSGITQGLVERGDSMNSQDDTIARLTPAPEGPILRQTGQLMKQAEELAELVLSCIYSEPETCRHKANQFIKDVRSQYPSNHSQNEKS